MHADDDADVDPAKELLRAVGELSGIIDNKDLILAPVWGGAADNDFHWTLLVIERKGKELRIRYRDSLTSQCSSCTQHAKEILMLLLMAMQITIDHALPPRCNLAMQPIGDSVCGHYVCHWTRLEMHLFCGEGHANGYPDWHFWAKKLMMMESHIIKNKGVADLHDKMADKEKANMLLLQQQIEQIRETLEMDAKMQAMAAEMASNWIHSAFGTIGGCPKCGHLKWGSTCCNPEKITAKIQAEEEMATEKGWDASRDGNYDKKRYQQIYEQVLKDKALEMTTDCKPLQKKDKGGGPVVVVNMGKNIYS